GVERVYEDDLRGQPEVEKLEVDSKGRVLRTLGTQAAVQGHDVQLTIDLDIQRLTEESLQQGLNAAHSAYDKQQAKHFIAPAGAAVVMDTRDGSILALASHQTYDPSIFVNGVKPKVVDAVTDTSRRCP